MFLMPFIGLLAAISAETCVPARLDRAIVPQHPVATVEGGVVLLDLRVDEKGLVSTVQTLEGRNPFTKQVTEAVRRWTFVPAHINKRVQSRVGVLMIFRPRRILEFGPPQRKLKEPSSNDRPPLPVMISPLPYPANSVAEGFVVLQLQIDFRGDITKIELIEGSPPLAEVARTSVETWRFAPAKVGGQPVCGTTIVAVSFLRPVV